MSWYFKEFKMHTFWEDKEKILPLVKISILFFIFIFCQDHVFLSGDRKTENNLFDQ